MTLPASGPISFNAINVELGVAGTTNANINQASYRTLAGVPSGTISLSNFYGKSNRVVISLTASGNNYDVYANRGGSYVAGTSDITVTVPGTVGSANTGSYALLVPSAFSPTDTVTLVNNGVIQGAGGAGGRGAGTPSPGTGGFTAGTAGSTGGNAIYVNRPVTITNNGTIASGGGGGGGGAAGFTSPAQWYGGGGGGGGAGTVGGAGGALGNSYNIKPGFLGGLGSAGSAGTSPAGGAGGPGAFANSSDNNRSAGAGGVGGGRGAAGAGGGGVYLLNGPTNPNPPSPAQPGGATGYYIIGGGFVTWPAVGTRQGNAG